MPPVEVELLPHPARPRGAVRRIRVTIGHGAMDEELFLHFRVEGDISRLMLPAPGRSDRADGLWQHSCFEAFLGPVSGASYYEFNLSPSGAWAAYRFAERRAGRESPPMPAPVIGGMRAADAIEMRAVLSLAALPGLAREPAIRAGLAVVIEESDGSLVYWALAHRAAKPDFHDPATFILRLPAE